MWDGLENQNPEVRPNPWAHCGLEMIPLIETGH
jgi:hypothetical protein